MRILVGDLYVFMIAHVVLLNHRQGCCVVEVPPLALHLLVRFGEQVHGLPMAVAAFLPSGFRALCCFEPTLGTAVAARIMNHHAISQCGKRLEPNVYACLLPGERERLCGEPRHRSSTHTDPPSASLETVTVLGVPSTWRDQRTATRPIFDKTKKR